MLHHQVDYRHRSGENHNYTVAQMGHADAQMVYRVYDAWMSENNTAQLSLINMKMNNFVLHM